MQHSSQSTAAEKYAASTTSPHGTSKPKKVVVLPLIYLRSILIDKNYAESDIDLFIGIMLHEINSKLINSPVSFNNQKRNSKANPNSAHLQVVTSQWLALSEELFFTLDTPGYGAWSFDECYFYSTCLLIGLQGWQGIEELEADLALSSTTAATLAMMKECGAHPLVNAHHHRRHSSTAIHRMIRRGSSATMSTGLSKSHDGDIHQQPPSFLSLAMFKRYLLRKALGEGELASLVAHVKRCVAQVTRVAQGVATAGDLLLAMTPLEHRLVTLPTPNKGSLSGYHHAFLGPPRLWTAAVLQAAGYDEHHLEIPLAKLPPQVLFLLSAEGESAVSGVLRAIELQVDFHAVPLPLFTPAAEDVEGRDVTNPLFSSTAAQEELMENAHRLWSCAMHWLLPPTATAAVSMSTAGKGDHRDPVLHLIIMALWQYKRLQSLSAAALFDGAIALFGEASGQAGESSDRGLSVLCAGLVPKEEEHLLMELGAVESSPPPAHHVASYDHSQQLLHPSAPPLPFEDEVDGYNQQQQEGGMMPPLPRAMSPYHASPEHKDSSSNNAAAMLLSDLSPVTTPHAGASLPRYFQPTATSLAKTIKSPLSGSGNGALAMEDLNVSMQQSSMLSPTVEEKKQMAQWATLLDSRTNTAAYANNSNNNAQQVQVQQQQTRAQAQAQAQAKREEPESEVEAPPSSTNNTSNQLDAKEKRLVEQLLISTDIAEQLALLEQIKTLRLIPAESSATGSVNDSNGSGRPPQQQKANDSGSNTSSKDKAAAVVASPNRSVRPASAPVASGEGSGRQREGYAASMASSSSSLTFASQPSSIAELLAAQRSQLAPGQQPSPGQVAQLLREILRRMSRSDSQVRLQSLEQVLRLGNDLLTQGTSSGDEAGGTGTGQGQGQAAGQGEAETKPKRNIIIGTTPAKPRLSGPAQTLAVQALSNGTGKKAAAAASASSTPAFNNGSGSGNNSSGSSANNNANNRPSSNGGFRAVQRTARVPGTMPDQAQQKKGGVAGQKVFGHAIGK